MSPENYLKIRPNGAPSSDWDKCVIGESKWPLVEQWAHKHGMSWGRCSFDDPGFAANLFSHGPYTALYLDVSESDGHRKITLSRLGSGNITKKDAMLMIRTNHQAYGKIPVDIGLLLGHQPEEMEF